MVIKQLGAKIRILVQALLEIIKVDFRASALSIVHGATEQSFAKSMLTKDLKRQIKQQIFKNYALATLNGTAKPENSISVHWMGKNVTHLLSILDC